MLESAALAFGWINPLWGQMASSPCRDDKPQSAHHPSCICVCVSDWPAKMVDGSVLEYDASLAAQRLCSVGPQACVACVLKVFHGVIPQCLLGKCGLASKHVC